VLKMPEAEGGQGSSGARRDRVESKSYLCITPLYPET
jgi:hypothetical protein